MSRSAVETFLRTLILGDFEEHQNTAGQIVGGLLGLIPGLDQVLDARDIAGTLFNINKSGGFAHATPDQLVNLGFAAFGAIPEVGSVFKATFKPLYRERKLAKGAVHSGLHKLESMLHMDKGGALTWIRKELLGKWAHRTNQIIQQVNAALNSAIQIVEFMAYATGWKDWLIPDPIQDLCKQLLPGLKAMRGKLNAPLQRASDEIRHFLEDLLGEQAAGVLIAIGQRAAPVSAVPGTRTRSGHNAAALVPHGKAPPPQKQKKVGGTPQTHGSKGQGLSHNAIQSTRDKVLAAGNDFLSANGEHIADYMCAKNFGWGANWRSHDDGAAGKWTKHPDDKNPGKLGGGSNKGPARNALYKLSSSPNGSGLDAVWHATGHNEGKPYAIVEAKATADEDGPKFLRKPGNTRKPKFGSMLEAPGDPSLILEPLGENAPTSRGAGKPKAGKKPTGSKAAGGKPKTPPAAPAAPVTPGSSNTTPPPTKAPSKAGRPAKPLMVQLSHEWIESNIRGAVERSISNEIVLKGSSLYSRHLFFSPLYHKNALLHAESLLTGAPQAQHSDHDAFHYGESEVKKAVNKRKKGLRARYGNLPTLNDEP